MADAEGEGMNREEIFTNELIKSIVQHPDKMSDCYNHVIYIKEIDGKEFFVYAEPEPTDGKEVQDIRCAGFMLKVDYSKKEVPNDNP